MVRQLCVLTAAILVPLVMPARDASAQVQLRMCLERSGGGSEKEFLAFDRELRAALSGPDWTLLTLLAAYPLRINDADGTTWIENAPTLASRGAAVLPAAVRSAVLATPVAEVICTSSAIGFGNGALWVKSSKQFGVDRFAISTINVEARAAAERAGVAFVCRADDYRIVVDRLPNLTLRYRSWNRPRTTMDKPDLEVAGGEEDYSGTGPCAHRSWTFTNANAEYSIAELGCTAETPPKGAVGELSVSVDGKHKAYSWCY